MSRERERGESGPPSIRSPAIDCGVFAVRNIVFSRNANRKSITTDVVRANNFAFKLDSPENEVEENGEGVEEFEEKKKYSVFIRVTFNFAVRGGNCAALIIIERSARDLHATFNAIAHDVVHLIRLTLSFEIAHARGGYRCYFNMLDLRSDMNNISAIIARKKSYRFGKR